MKIISRYAYLPVICVLLTCCATASEPVDAEQARRVCDRWLQQIADSEKGWDGARTPSVISRETLVVDGSRLGHYFTIAPRGYVLVAADKALPPVLASSETTRARNAADNPVLDYILPRLGTKMADIRQSDFPAEPAWARYLPPPGTAPQSMKSAAFEEIGPLLTTHWGQEQPFNLYCPTISGYTTKLGCVATATAQVIAYHQWPVSDVGDHSYTWNGDQSCGGDSPEQTVYADFSDPYDWANMPDSAVDVTPVDQQAVAELCYETAVAVEMDFGLCSSSTSLSRARYALVDYFRYKSTASEQLRFRFPTATWFSMIQQNIAAGRPVIYYTVVHVLVCDGTREVDGIQQIHLNYGWQGDADGWFALDSIYTSVNPYSERMIINIEPQTDQPIALDDFTVQGGSQGVIVSWDLSPTADHVSFRLYRDARREKTMSPVKDVATMFGTHYEVHEAYLPPGHYEYWLEGWQKSGNRQWFGPATFDLVTAAPPPPVPRALRLERPYPNPFNPRTTIEFEAPAGGMSRLAIYDTGGRLVRVLVDGIVGDTRQRVVWDGRDQAGRLLPSGGYFVRLSGDGADRVRKITLLR